jgi:hypothetical protein
MFFSFSVEWQDTSYVPCLNKTVQTGRTAGGGINNILVLKVRHKKQEIFSATLQP